MNYLKRLSYYSKEQLHPGSRLFLSFIIAVFVQVLFNLHFKVTTSWHILLVPALAPFCLLIYYRVSDEFKDYETDKKYFPDRPVPSGRVYLSDLKSVMVIVSVLGFIINFLMPFAIKEFLAAWVFTVLMGKWFFMEKWIANNRLLAFITHAPVGLFLYWYVIKFYLHFHSKELLESSILALIGFFVLPGLTWEILRKTYLPQDEKEGYQTYSEMLGFKGSLAFGLLLLALTALNNFALASSFPLLKDIPFLLAIINGLMFLGVVTQMIRAWIPNLRPVVEVYMAIHLLAPLGYLMWLSHV